MVPNLRFDFLLSWKTYKVDNIIESCGGGTPSTKVISYWQGDIPWISSSDLFENNIRDINVSRYITKEAIKCSATKLCPKETICIVSRVGVGKVVVTTEPLCTSQDFMNITHFEGNKYFLAQLIQNKIKSSQLQGTSIKGITSKEIKDMRLFIPSRAEQDKIVKFLNLIDQRIETQIKIIDTLSSQKKQIRNLIFKDIHKNTNCCIQDYVIYEQPQKYIVHSTDYLSYGKDYTPVLTANQSFILGYTLEKDGIYEKGDCIIFDDFTNENKYVDFPFKVKSSALKILQTKEGLMLKFFYEYLQFLNFESTDHKRHYLSEVAVTDISVPNLKEQTFVCKIFTSFDNKLKNEEALLEKYRLQKQFLLNNLFI